MVRKRTFEQNEFQADFPESLRVLRAEDVPDRDLEVARIPAGVVEIAPGAFRGCARLRRVVFAPGSRLEVVGAEAFRGTGLVEFVAPGTLRRVGAGAFAQCLKLVRAEFSDGVEELGEGVGRGADEGVGQAG